MAQVSRPMQVVLLVTVLFAAVWFVALRPKSGGDGAAAPVAHAAPTAPGVKGLTTAIDKAHHAVDAANAASQKATGSTTGGAAAPAATPAHRHATRTHSDAAAPHRHRHVASRAHRRAAAQARHRAARALARHVAAVRAALRHHRVIAIAFVDPAAADSRAVADELRHVDTFRGRALTLVVPIGDLSSYGVITREVQVTTAPTTVIIARDGGATTITGFADRFEIEQRLADALVKRP